MFLYLLLSSSTVFSQNNALYLHHEIPQAISLNPAIENSCKTYIGFPALSSIQYAFNSSSFTYNDFIRQGTGSKSDSLIFDYENVFNQIKRNNRVQNSAELVWLDFGFRKKKRYFSFNLKSKLAINLYYTDDLFGLLSGNWNSDDDTPLNFQLANNKLDVLGYTSLSAAVSQEINSNLRIGIRLSYLQGAALFKTQKSYFSIETNDNPVEIQFTPDYNINASFPMTFSYDSQGLMEQIRPVFSNPIANFLLNKNRGASIDLGFDYKHSEKISFSGSILDLGFIYWQTNTLNLQTSGSFNFQGIDLNQYTSGTVLQTDIQTILKDSVKQLFHYQQGQKSFFSLLPAQIYFAGNYNLTEKLKIGLINHFFWSAHAIFFTQTGSINYSLSSNINMSAGISYMNNQITNLGLAVVLKKEPIQFYFVTDNLPFKFVKDTKTSYILPSNVRSLNFRVGLNIVFGCEAKDKSRDNTYCPAYH